MVVIKVKRAAILILLNLIMTKLLRLCIWNCAQACLIATEIDLPSGMANCCHLVANSESKLLTRIEWMIEWMNLRATKRPLAYLLYFVFNIIWSSLFCKLSLKCFELSQYLLYPRTSQIHITLVSNHDVQGQGRPTTNRHKSQLNCSTWNYCMLFTPN
jgi:hypothetical protein